MTSLALKGLAGRRLRTALTALAIVLGVAMVAGGFTLTDTMRHAADSLSASAYRGTDAVVSAHTAFKHSAEDDTQVPTVPPSLVAKVRSEPGVAVAAPTITDDARIVGSDGKVVGSGPYFGVGYDARTPGAARLQPFRLTDGRWAAGPGQVVIDAGTARKHHLGVGDRVRVVARGPVRTFRVAGIATFGGVKSLGTATLAIFDLPTAQRIFDKRGGFDSVLVAARPGTAPAALRAQLRRDLGPSVQVQTAAGQDRFDLEGLKQFISIIRTFLLVFAGVAVFVGAFTIFNTLSITVAQRARELATLRTIGASRQQVMRSVLLEALAMGAGASIAGLFAGLGLAKGIDSLFTSIGLELPQTGTVFSARTIVVALLVGILVTVFAGMVPALRATRVSPVSMLREGAVLPVGRVGRRSGHIAVVTSSLALALLAVGLFASGMSTGSRFALIGPGCVLLFLGVAAAAPRLAVPLASVLGRPGERVAGAAGGLARRNAMRNPGRTAATAAALMIGVALVVFVAVFASGLKSSARGDMDKHIHAGYVVIGSDGWSSVDPSAVRAVSQAPGVRRVATLKQDQARALGSKVTVNGLSPAFADLYGFQWREGSDAALRGLGATGAVVRSDWASKHHVHAGERITLTAASGKRLTLRVAGVFKQPKADMLNLGSVTVSQATFGRTFVTKVDRFAFVDAPGGDSTLRALKGRLASFPSADVKTKDGFISAQVDWMNQLLAIFYVLLALSVVVSLFGMVNTLVLSVFERTRELGMLRAVGMTRRQVRRMVRHESVVTALIGATLGIAVGLVLAGLVIGAIHGMTFAVPIGSLIAFVIVAIVAGMLAAILPARRASRLDVLSALAAE